MRMNLAIHGLLAGLGAALLSFPAAKAAIELDLDWQLKPGDRSYLSGFESTERGLAYRTASNNLLLVSRQGAPAIYVLSAVDGSEQHTLDTSAVSGGFFPLNKVAVADDGAIYAANMTLDASSSAFTIYRWENDDLNGPASIAYQGDPGALDGIPGQRWGDTLQVRGSGATTQIIAGSNSSSAVAVITTEDGQEFDDVAVFTGVSDGDGVLGLAFGPGDSFYTKKSSAVLRQVEFDLAMGTSTVQTIASDTAIRVLGSRVADDYLATMTLDRVPAGPGTVPDTLTILNISDPAAPVNETTAALVVDNDQGIDYDSDNPNGAGAIVFGGTNVYVLSTNSGIFCWSIEEIGVAPPNIDADPLSSTVLQDGIVSFSVSASGDQPLSYQWTFEGSDIPGANTPVLEVGPVALNDAGAYAVRVSNNAGSATSENAVLTVVERIDGPETTPRWTVAAESRPWLSASARTHRGMAVNPTNGNVLVVSRELGNRIYVLDGATGADLHELDTTGVSGGIFALNMIGVAEDGAVYAGNLTLNGLAGSYNLYRWPSDAPGVPPSQAFLADPANGLSAERWGDTMDVRGSGASTQILLGSRLGSVVSVLTTPDGVNFTANPIATDGVAGDFGLGVSFGDGNTAWGSTAGRGLRRVAFDLGLGSATTTHLYETADFPAGATAIAVDPVLKCLAALVLDAPNTLQVFDISNLENPPVLLDQELLNSGRANVNTDGTGAVDFGPGVLAGLATNHGVLCLDNIKEAPFLPVTIQSFSLVGPSRDQLQIILTGPPETPYLIQFSNDLLTWTNEINSELDEEGEDFLILPTDAPDREYLRVVTLDP